MNPRLKTLAALLPLLPFCPAHAGENPMALDPMVVTATRQAMRASEVLSDITVIDREELEKNGQGSVADLLARQSGLQIASNGGPGTTTSFYVRGANAAQTLILVDGLPINSVDLSGSPLRFMPLANVERIEILRGPASTLYGANAIGGVIQIITKRGEPGLQGDIFLGYGTENTLQSSAGIGGGSDQWRFRIDGGHVSSTGFSTQTHATKADADKDGYFNNNGSASLSFLPAAGHEIGAIYRQNDGVTRFDSGNVPANGNFDDRIRFTTEQWQLFTKNRLTDFWTSTLRYGQTDDYQKNYRASSPQGKYLETLNTQITWQNDFALPLGKALLATEYFEQKATPKESYNEKNKIDNTSVQLGWNASWQDHRWQISGRHDQNSAWGGQNTYSLGYGYQITSSLLARASYGTAFKAPSLYQLYAPFYGNAQLRPETGRNREVALVWGQGNHLVSATYFLNKIDNLIDFNMSTWNYYNVSAARLEGVSLAYDGQFGDWTLHAGYDWLNATNEDTDKHLGRRALHKLQASVGKSWGPAKLGVEWQYVGARYNTDEETGRMAAYNLVNLTGSYAIRRDLTLEGRINNLFDEKYETTLDYMNKYPYGTPGFNAFVGIRYAFR